MKRLQNEEDFTTQTTLKTNLNKNPKTKSLRGMHCGSSFCNLSCPFFIKNTPIGLNKSQFDPFFFSLVHRNYVCPNNINKSILNNNNNYSNHKGHPVDLIL